MRFFPEVRPTVWQAMIVITALAISFALAREHLTLGTVTGCVLVLTILRTLMLAQCQRREGEEVRDDESAGSSAHCVAPSPSSAPGADPYLFVYTVAALLMRERVSHSIPHVDMRAVVLGGLAGLAVGYRIRLWLWVPRNRRYGSRNARDPSP